MKPCFNFNSNFAVQIILVLNFCYSATIISIVIAIMEISVLIVNMTDDLTLQIHQHTQKHVNVQQQDIILFMK